MKKSIKYITLVFGSIAFAFFFLLAASLLLDIKNLEHPASLILPEIMFVLLLTTLIFLIIWGFKFSNNKPHKLYIIFMSICLSLTVLFFILSKVINPIITSSNITSDEYVTNFTLDTFHEKHKEFSGYDLLKTVQTVSDDDANTILALYKHPQSLPDGKTIDYTLSYDKTNKRISSILISSQTSPFYQATGETSNSNPYFHIYLDEILLWISPTISIDAVHQKIESLESGFYPDNYSVIYEDTSVSLFITANNPYLHANITLK